MRIGILTFHWAINYGAILQAYGLSSYLKQIKPTSSISVINFVPKEFSRSYSLNPIRKNPKSSIERILYILNGGYKRSKKFQQFANRELSLTKKITEIEKLKIILKDFDAVVVGSDQVWNKEIVGGYINAFVLKDISNVKKISYSASIGNCRNISMVEEELLYVAKNFHSISVREKCLAEYFYHIGRGDVCVTIDPVLLFNMNFWESRFKHLDSDYYILVYMLDFDPRVMNIAKLVSEVLELPIISVEPPVYRKFKYKKAFADKYIYTCGPDEFLSYIRNASFIITNSFHGTAFSVIFEKPFITVPHPTRNDRIASLLKMLNLENYMVSNLGKKELINALDKYPLYLENSKMILKDFQESSGDFLKRSLS